MAHPSLRDGDIIAYLPYSWIGRLFSAYSGKYSHVSIVWDASRFLEIRADFRGVRIIHIPFLPFHIYRSKKTFNNYKAKKWAITQIGKIYPYIDLLGFLLKRMFVNAPIINIKSLYYCSEFAVKYFQEGGLLKNVDGRVISPTDLTNFWEFKKIML